MLSSSLCVARAKRPLLANKTVNERVRMLNAARKVTYAWYVTPCASGGRNHHASLQLSCVFQGMKGQPRKYQYIYQNN